MSGRIRRNSHRLMFGTLVTLFSIFLLLCLSSNMILTERIERNYSKEYSALPRPAPKGFIHPSRAQFLKNQLETISLTFLVNLKKRPDRLQYMKSQLTNLSIPFIRVIAVDFNYGKDLRKIAELKNSLHPDTNMNITTVARQIQERHKNAVNWGSVGCWQSHLQIYLQIANGSYRHVSGPFLILEDDVKLLPHFLEVLSEEYLYQYLPSDWEMLYLDHLNLNCRNDSSWSRPRDKRATRQYCMINYVWTNSAYVIRSQNVVKKLIAAGNTPDLQVADWYVSRLFRTKAVTGYALKNKAAAQVRNSKFGSNIYGTDHKPGTSAQPKFKSLHY